MTRMLKTFMRNKKPMWKCGDSKCLLINSWRCSECGCVDNTMSGLAMDGIAMASIEPEVVEPKKKRSRKKKVEETVEEVVEETVEEEIPEVLSLDELSK